MLVAQSFLNHSSVLKRACNSIHFDVYESVVVKVHTCSSAL